MFEVIDEHRSLKSEELSFKDAKIERCICGNLDRLLLHNQGGWPPIRMHLVKQRVWRDYQSLTYLFRVKHHSVIGSISRGVPLDVQLCGEC